MGTQLPDVFSTEGPEEHEIVASALDDMMTRAYQKVVEISVQQECNFRIASFYKALKDISGIYDIYGLTI